FTGVIRAYKSNNCEGEAFETSSKMGKFPFPDWNDSIFSASIEGVWVFYENTYFNSREDGLEEYMFSASTDCRAFQKVGGKISSFQYVGNQWDYKANSLTLFKRTNFQGGHDEQVCLEGSNNEIPLPEHQSLIITGTFPWMVFQHPNYRGAFFCLIPPESNDVAPYAISDLTSADIPYNFIRSAKLGCDEIEPPYDDVEDF
ncbi:unnamed protein product, partial [Allacma fusca]